MCLQWMKEWKKKEVSAGIEAILQNLREKGLAI